MKKVADYFNIAFFKDGFRFSRNLYPKPIFKESDFLMAGGPPG